MPTVAELVAADPAALLHRAREWEALAAALTARATDLDRPGTRPPDGWSGADADAAGVAHARLRDRLTGAAATADRICRVLGRYAGETLHAQRRLLEAVVAVNAGTTRVDLATGSITVAPSLSSGVTDVGRGLFEFVADAVRFRTEATAALAAAAKADADAVTELAALGPGPGPEPVRLPAAGTAPADVRAWWAGLTPAQRDLATRTDPAAVGALVGVPVADRDRANRIRLDVEHDRLTALRRAQGIDPAGAARTGAALAGLDLLRRRLDAGGARLLDIAAGRLVVAVGDPERAEHVVTHVPGTGAGWASAGEDLRRAEATRDSARAAGTGEVAAILWTGYDAPPTLAAAASDRAARDGADALRAFQHGLRDARAEPVHLTVVGHSYGTTLVGHAARDGGLTADDLVLVGSPGAGVRTATELGVPDGRVWATRAAHDPIAWAPGPELFATSRWSGEQGLAHGRDPTGPAFGARVFDSAPGPPLPTPDDPATPTDESAIAAAHSMYWEPGSPSLDTLGRIVAGATGDP